MKKKLCKNIIFSKTPLLGCFKYEDLFQIYPCDFTNAPQSEYADDIPLVIEFWVDEDQKVEVGETYKEIEELMVSTSIQETERNRITRFLSSVTNHRFFSYSHQGVKWGIPFPNMQESKEKINGSSSQPIIGIYSYPGLQSDLFITEFSNKQIPLPDPIDHKLYYVHDPFENKKGKITLPNTIYILLEKYYSLEPKTRKKIDTICHLICNGLDLEREMKSLSFLSFVSAVETLVSIEYKGRSKEVELDCKDCQSIKSSPISCDTCGRPLWAISAKFREFLTKYVATSDTAKKKFGRIYGLRSRIVHNGSLLLGDEQMDWSESDKLDSEWMIHQEAKQMARLAVANWLLMKDN